MSETVPSAWSSLTAPIRPKDPEGSHEVNLAFARCFSGSDGERALAHLKAITLDRALGPNASDATLRSLDGQRCLVLHIQSLINRGRNPA